MYNTRHVRQFKQCVAVKVLLDCGIVLEVLVDDFLLGSPSVDDHRQLLELWLNYAEQNHLRFKRTKCEFFMPTLVVLGRQVGWNEWGPVPDRLPHICAVRPKNQTELQSLLGSVNWIRRHIVDVSSTFVLLSCYERASDGNGQTGTKRRG